MTCHGCEAKVHKDCLTFINFGGRYRLLMCEGCVDHLNGQCDEVRGYALRCGHTWKDEDWFAQLWEAHRQGARLAPASHGA